MATRRRSINQIVAAMKLHPMDKLQIALIAACNDFAFKQTIQTYRALGQAMADAERAHFDAHLMRKGRQR